jgi:cell division protein FtsI (penicillin-binding protein 3)
MENKAARGLKRRITTILALIGVGAAAILARGVQLQVLKAGELKQEAARQHEHTIKLKAERGAILDNQGEALAVSSMKKTQVFARPDKVEDPKAAARELARVLDMEARRLEKKLGEKNRQFIWIDRYAKEKQAEAIEKLDLSGIGVFPAIRRYYPGGPLAANLLGFTGVEGQGLEGLEYYYEETLRGSTIRIWQEKDGRGNSIFLSKKSGAGMSGKASAGGVYESLTHVNAKGSSIKLTILRPLQYVVERELEAAMKKTGAKAGCILAMEPDSGRILAMASWPDFDPNNFREYSQENFRNRCVAGSYEPGSTFKVFTTSAALEDRAISPREKFYCENGAYLLGGETITDTKAHGFLDVSEIITYSSNIGASKIGERLGKQRLYEAIKDFGFGVKTGIDCPGESSGLVRDYKRWSQVAVGTISFGQGVAVTPLQNVTALSAIANKGALMRPYLAEYVIKPDGTEKRLHRPEKVRQAVTPEVAMLMTEYMKMVVSPEGTGSRAEVPGYSVAGKTGTAQKPKEKSRGYAEGKYVSSFMGFLPASAPRLAMIVVIDEPASDRPYGGVVAAPVFRNIAKKAMILLKVPAEENMAAFKREGDNLEISGASHFDNLRKWEKKREWKEKEKNRQRQFGEMVMPDVHGLTLRRALDELASLQVQVEVKGTGLVKAQSPAPATGLEEGDIVRIKLEARL